MNTVVITGVSHGLGNYVAQAFLDASWHVIGTGRSGRPESLNEAIDYHQFDASDANSSDKFWNELSTSDGEVCLVNNAGGFVSGGLLSTNVDDYEKQIKSNYFSSVYMTRGLAEHVASARIISIISNSALNPNANTPAYGAAKAASKYFFQSLQKEFSVDKYRFTNIYPSDIATSAPNPESIDPKELAAFIVELAESSTSYYPTDITLFPTKRFAS